jgi:hypothetical protein
MFDNDYYIHIRNKWEASLFSLPGVRAVGLGPKFVRNRPIGQLAIQVYVEEKKPASALPPGELVPPFIEQIPTDIRLWGGITKTAGTAACKTGGIQGIHAITTGSNVAALEIHSPAHGLFNGVWVRFTGPDEIRATNIAFQVTVMDADHFRINTLEDGIEKNPFMMPFTSTGAGWIQVSNLNTLCCCPSGNIQTILSSPGHVEITSTAHGLLDGDSVKILKSGPALEPAIYTIKKTDPNNFRLLNADDTQFTSNPGGWRWFKVSMCLTGSVTTIDRTNPVVIHSHQHGLKNKDKIVIITVDNGPHDHLDNLVGRNGPDPEPYEVSQVTEHTFAISTVNASSWPAQDPQKTFIGAWIKVTEDNRRYARLAGGMRLQLEESTEVIPLSTGERKITHYNVGTLGCMATDNVFNRKVLLSNAHVLFSGGNDNEVHHPDHYEISKTCSSHKVAKRVKMVFGPDPETGFTVDAAIAAIEKDIKYDPVILDIGAVKGTYKIFPTDIANGDYRVWKRGAMTQITEGIVTSTNYSYDDDKGKFRWENQLLIEPLMGAHRGIMVIHGDSGSVAVNKDNRVVGLINKGGEDGSAFANPIDQVEQALQITIWREGQPLTAGEGNGPEQEQEVSPGIPYLLASAMEELKQTENGNLFVGLLQNHIPALLMMVNNNKKFALAWQRNHGPALLKSLRQAMAVRTRRVPASIQGKPFSEWLQNIFNAVKAYGSERLVADLERYEAQFIQMLAFTFEELLENLRQNKLFRLHHQIYP